MWGRNPPSLETKVRASLPHGDNIDTPQTSGVLVQMLQSPHPDVRNAAAWALGQVGNRQALSALDHIARYDDGRTRGNNSVSKAAQDAIHKIRQRYGST